jgi:hypothetical protein
MERFASRDVGKENAYYCSRVIRSLCRSMSHMYSRNITLLPICSLFYTRRFLVLLQMAFEQGHDAP